MTFLVMLIPGKSHFRVSIGQSRVSDSISTEYLPVMVCVQVVAAPPPPLEHPANSQQGWSTTTVAWWSCSHIHMGGLLQESRSSTSRVVNHEWLGQGSHHTQIADSVSHWYSFCDQQWRPHKWLFHCVCVCVPSHSL